MLSYTRLVPKNKKIDIVWVNRTFNILHPASIIIIDKHVVYGSKANII
jgi:hypothetical protein